MNPRRIFLALIIIAMMAATATAQSQTRTKWERLDAENQAGGAGSVTQSRTDSQLRASGTQITVTGSDDGFKNRIEGTWRAAPEIFGDINSLFTFGAGKDSNDGTVAHSANVSFVPFPSCLGGQGAWKRTGERSFVGTDEAFCFDAGNGFVPAGKVKFRYAINLNKAGTEFDGTAQIEGFDPFGNLVFSESGLIHAARMQAEAPTP